MDKIIKLFIGGEWLDAKDRDRVPVNDPATGKTMAQLCQATRDDLDLALDSAYHGFDIWRRMPTQERGAIMNRAAESIRDQAGEIAQILTREQGKTLGQAKGEVLATASYFSELAQVGQRITGRLLPPDASGVSRSITLEPIGPVFAVSPWNLPAMMPGRKIANSLAAGCSIIVKPATETPETAYLLARICQESGVPDGVVNVVSGPSGLISDTLIESSIIRKISFTGSTEVGKALASKAGACMKKVTMELGGHAPVIVYADVDVEQVARMSAAVRHANAGQSCMAPTRFFVHERAYSAFVEAFTEHSKALRVGNGLDANTDMGPLVNIRRLGKMEEIVDDAVRCGATLKTGGQRLKGSGCFFPPTVLSDVPHEALIMTEEPFGPVTAIVSFTDRDDIIARANGTPYGLTAYIFTSNLSKANHIAADLEAGLVGINSFGVAGPTVPFGGVKDSGIGREGALEGVLESMTVKSVSIAT